MERYMLEFTMKDLQDQHIDKRTNYTTRHTSCNQKQLVDQAGHIVRYNIINEQKELQSGNQGKEKDILADNTNNGEMI